MAFFPNLEDYDVSRENGFLSALPPLQELGDPYYEPWEFIIGNLQGLLLSRRLHETVHRMPQLKTENLLNESQWRRAYSILAFIVHAYIWGDKQPKDYVPANLAVPFMSTCRHLELPLVSTYAGLVLWNWKPIFEHEPTDSLANLDIIETFTGSLDEKWFYLVSVAIEAQGAVLIPLMLEAMRAAQDGDQDVVTAHLRLFAEKIDELGVLLGRMYDHCDPHVFYHRLRPFLAGSKNMADAGLPNGVIFDNGGPMNKQKYVQYSGGSNAQSSLIQFMDIVLGVAHRPTEADKAISDESEATIFAKQAKPNFILEMRKYMPGSHARFLHAVQLVSNIREFVALHQHNKELTTAFDASLAMLSAFRDKHIQIVSRYIVVKSHEAKKTRGEEKSLSLRSKPLEGRTLQSSRPRRLIGTGGTSLIPFLQQARAETSDAAFEEWTRRLLDRPRKNRTNLLVK